MIGKWYILFRSYYNTIIEKVLDFVPYIIYVLVCVEYNYLGFERKKMLIGPQHG